MRLVDRDIRLDQADIAGNRDAARLGQEREARLRLAEGVGGEVGEHRYITPLRDQPFHDRDAVVIGVRHHLVPIFAEGPDMLFARRVLFYQQGFGLRPGAAAVLLDVPVMSADIGEEPVALGLVRDEAAERKMRIVMNKDFADVENDMSYVGGHGHPLDVLNARGIAAAIAFS